MRHLAKQFFRCLRASLWYVRRRFQSKDSPPNIGDGIWSKKDFK